MKIELERLLANLFFGGGVVTIVYACFRINFSFGLIVLGCLLIWLSSLRLHFGKKKTKKIKTGEKK